MTRQVESEQGTPARVGGGGGGPWPPATLSGGQVWFRIAEEAINRLPEKTPTDRGRRLVDALIVWITPDRPLHPGINRFEVRVSEAGEAWIERLRW